MRTIGPFIFLLCFAALANTVSADCARHSYALEGLRLEQQRNPSELFSPDTPGDKQRAIPPAPGKWDLYTRTENINSFGSVAGGQVSGENSGGRYRFVNADKAARQSSNPLGGDFMMLFNQFDSFFLRGSSSDHTRHLTVWSVQPVVPVPMGKTIGENWIWVHRPEFTFILNGEVPDLDNIPGKKGRVESALQPPGVPITDDDYPEGGLPFDRKSGFGDINYASLLGKSAYRKWWGGGDFVRAFGASFQFPTASDPQLGSGKYSAGPAGALAFIGRKYILGGLYQQLLSYADGGRGPGNNVHFSRLNLFYFLNLANGWQVGGTPILTADWESDGNNERFTVPVGLGVYKTHLLGKTAMRLGLEVQYMPLKPDKLGQELNIRVVVAPIFRSIFN